MMFFISLLALGCHSNESAQLAQADKDLNDENPLVRVEAARAICAIDPNRKKTVVPVLVRAADGEQEVYGDKSIARNLAIIALGEIGPDASSAVPILKKRLNGKSPYERVLAAAAMTQIDNATCDIAIPILVEGLNDEQIIRVTAALALCRLGKDAEDFMPSVRKLLEDDDDFVRSEVAKALRLSRIK